MKREKSERQAPEEAVEPPQLVKVVADDKEEAEGGEGEEGGVLHDPGRASAKDRRGGFGEACGTRRRRVEREGEGGESEREFRADSTRQAPWGRREGSAQRVRRLQARIGTSREEI